MRYITIACPFIVTLLAVIIDEKLSRDAMARVEHSSVGIPGLVSDQGRKLAVWLIRASLSIAADAGPCNWLVIG